MKAPRLRSDAARRRAALLQAAKTVFEKHGLDVPLDAIAQAAGVGRATLYRNFPDRERLLKALLDLELDLLAETLEKIDLIAEPFALIEALADSSLKNATLFTYWRSVPADTDSRRQSRAKFLNTVRRPLAKMLRSKQVRRDLRVEDILLIGMMLSSAQHGATDKERLQLSQRASELLKAAVQTR